MKKILRYTFALAIVFVMAFSSFKTIDLFAVKVSAESGSGFYSGSYAEDPENIFDIMDPNGKFMLRYKLDRNVDQLSVIGCETYAENTAVTVPYTILTPLHPDEYYHVTSIGANAFTGQTNITAVYGMRNIKTIGPYAFMNCTNLKSVDATTVATGIGLRKISTAAFKNCTSLNNAKTLVEYAVSISDSAFENAGTLTPTGAVRLNNSFIGRSAFKSSGITSVVIGSTSKIDTINASTFANCKSLTSFSIEKNKGKPSNIDTRIKKIDNYAFANSAISKISLMEMSALMTIGTGAFENCPITDLTPDNGFAESEWLIVGRKSYLNQSLSIGRDAFRNAGVKTASFGGPLTLGDRAFMGCPMDEVFILNDNAQLGEKSIGYLDETTKSLSTVISGRKAAQDYAAQNGLACNSLAYDTPTPIDFTDYMWGTENRDYAYGKNGLYYLDYITAGDMGEFFAGSVRSNPFKGVCTGLPALSCLKYNNISAHNPLKMVPTIYNDNGMPVTNFSEVNENNINDELRSIITYYWTEANGMNTYQVTNMQDFFHYCRLMNSGKASPCMMTHDTHCFVAYGAQYRYEAPDSPYWEMTFPLDGVIATFDARILIYDNNYHYLPDGTIDNGWNQSGDPLNRADLSYIYLNTTTGQWSWFGTKHTYGVPEYNDVQKMGYTPSDVLLSIAPPTSLVYDMEWLKYNGMYGSGYYVGSNRKADIDSGNFVAWSKEAVNDTDILNLYVGTGMELDAGDMTSDQVVSEYLKTYCSGRNQSALLYNVKRVYVYIGSSEKGQGLLKYSSKLG